MRQERTSGLLACLLLAAGAPALAGEDGRGWFVEFGGASISFDESATISAGGSEIPGAGASLTDDVSIAVGLGYFLTPAILSGVDHRMKVMTEETFGPVCPIMPFDTEAEALALAIDRDEIAHRQPELAAPKPQREWAQKLLAEDGGAEALQDLIADQPSADVQQLRSLIRQTKKLQTSAKALQNTQPPVPDKAYAEHQAAKRALKKLERYLAGVLGAEGDSDDEGDGGEDEA